MPDYSAVAAAIAARYAPAQVTPPAGLVNVRSSSADLPQALDALPCFLVFTDQGNLDPGNGTRLGSSNFLGRFYFAEAGDLARSTNAIVKWLTVLVGQHLTSLQLGGLVVAVRTRRWKIGTMNYAGKDYDGLELGLEAITSEPWSPTA